MALDVLHVLTERLGRDLVLVIKRKFLKRLDVALGEQADVWLRLIEVVNPHLSRS